MITEISLNKKRVLIITCILFSILIHLVPLKMRVYTTFFNNIRESMVGQQQINTKEPITPNSTIKPLMLTNQLPHDVLKKLQALKKRQTTLPQAATPAPIFIKQAPPTHSALIQPLPQSKPEPIPSTHKLFRAGTGFDAPQTDDALSFNQPKTKIKQLQPKRIDEQKFQEPEKRTAALPNKMQQPEPTPIVTEKNSSPENIKENTRSQVPRSPSAHNLSTTGRLALRTHMTENNTQYDKIIKVPVNELEPAYAESAEHTEQAPAPEKNKPGLNFLSQENFEQIIRGQIKTDDDANFEDNQASTSEFYGSFYGASATHNQYGDPRFLHYNSKIYSALQQSMTLVVNSLSATQYRTALDGVRNPTRIRFALDQDGNIISIVITRSSGNLRYDNLAYKIVQEASYPSIPKSFGLTRTYHQYGILLYDVGPGPHQNIGVSPYLEGE